MIVYLTFNDSPSGIYKSQVIDRLTFLRSQEKQVQLIAFLPGFNFKNNKEKILNWDSSALVKKQLPGLRYWWSNLFQLFIILIKFKPQILIGRSIYATNLGLVSSYYGLVKTVIYDGRGAVTAECDEFNMVPKKWLKQIEHLEKKAIQKSNAQLSVSNSLIEYWKSKLDYNGNKFNITPCIVSEDFENVIISQQSILNSRKRLGFENDDIVVCYSGSLADWQFKKGLEVDLADWLIYSKKNKILFLSRKHKRIENLIDGFKSQVKQIFVSPEEVPQYLLAADYGLLVRDQNVTNKVASPVKFAEYLACGLKVIISNNLGDYSMLVEKLELGFTFSTLKLQQIQQISLAEKNLVRSKSLDYFSRQSKLDKLVEI